MKNDGLLQTTRRQKITNLDNGAALQHQKITNSV